MPVGVGLRCKLKVETSIMRASFVCGVQAFLIILAIKTSNTTERSFKYRQVFFRPFRGTTRSKGSLPGEEPNFAVHDFPNSEYGIKLGGFMIMGTKHLQSGSSRRANEVLKEGQIKYIKI